MLLFVSSTLHTRILVPSPVHGVRRTSAHSTSLPPTETETETETEETDKNQLTKRQVIPRNTPLILKRHAPVLFPKRSPPALLYFPLPVHLALPLSLTRDSAIAVPVRAHR
jgi:hypothetical protein